MIDGKEQFNKNLEELGDMNPAEAQESATQRGRIDALKERVEDLAGVIHLNRVSSKALEKKVEELEAETEESLQWIRFELKSFDDNRGKKPSLLDRIKAWKK
jgi:predicted  nucleic acid-binding Zn-ribbon protein